MIMLKTRTATLGLLLGFAVALAAPEARAADDYPQRTVTFICRPAAAPTS
jgi:hypothetical protein